MRETRVLCLLFVCLLAASAVAWEVDCGKEGQAPCSVSKAKLEGKSSLCPSGQFFDVIKGGTCWSCPPGYARTIPWGVDTEKACEKASTTDFRRAVERGKGSGWFGTDCGGGQFWDIVDGNCHSCDDGYSMMVLEHVHSDRKCARGIPASYARATNHGAPCGGNNTVWDMRNGGECWSCPKDFARTIAPVDSEYACEYKTIGGVTGLFGCAQGLSSIRNVCVKTGVCGKEGQRPCEITERVPSCDAGLRENFKTNQCVKLRTGETPFTGGVASLAEFWGATLQGRCKQLLGMIDIKGDTQGAVAARCSKDAAVGFACAFLRDFGAGYVELANTVLEMGPRVGTLAEEMNAAANRAPCTDFRERFAKTTRHGKPTGVLKTDCPAGQFWDPDGNCYSCPTDYTRTLFPVTHDRACTDRVGGNLQQFGCGAIEGIKAKFGGPTKCEVEMLENGSIFDKPIDVKNADRVVCEATGELGYNIVKMGFEAGKAAATGDISGILATIGKIKGTGTHAFDLQRLVACRRNARAGN